MRTQLISPIRTSNRNFRSRKGSVLNLVLIGLLSVVLLGTGTWFYLSGSGPSSLEQPLTSTAFKGPFIKEVLDQGEIQSSDNVEIRCKVKSRYGSRGVTVQDLAPEGTVVKGGDFLVRLRSDEIVENRDNQKIKVNNANDSVTAAQKDWEVAKLTKDEYELGKYEEEKELILNQISQAKTEFEKAIKYLESSEKLQAKGFITLTELQNDIAEKERRRRDYSSAERALKVLEKYTYNKNMEDFKSKIAIAKSKLEAAVANLEIEEKTLAEIEEQLAACEIKVPEGQSGQVVYANIFSRRGSSEFILEEGASVREGQVLIRLPNPNKMQVRATVNESVVTSIKEGMAVNISVDALNGKQLDGEVTKVNQYAEPEGWGGGGVRKYAVYIDILNPIPEIKPGMNASVLVQTESLDDALMIPIQGVYGYRGKTFCLVKKGDQWKTTEVAVGSNNDTNVVVTSGIEEGDEVALNPAGFKDLLELPDIPEVDDKDKKAKKGRSPKKQTGKNNKYKKDSGKSSKKGLQSKSKNNPGKKTANPNQDEKKGQDRKSGPNADTAKKPEKPEDKKA